MYAIIEAHGSNRVEGEAGWDRTWGEPRVIFTANTASECMEWWVKNREARPMWNEVSPYDYVMLLTPEGPRNLLNKPMHEHETGWVQCRLGHFGEPDKLT